jgi:hypothetical protein
MRMANALIVAFVALVLVAAYLPSPAYAQVVTTETTTFVNRFGNTVTTISTFYDGVLVFRDSQEVRPSGVVTLEKHWDFYSDGTVKSYTEERLDGAAPYTIDRQYDQNGVLRSYHADLYINGELSLQTFQTFDATGYLLTKEDRVLTTLADGTKVWNVTYETWSGDVLVSSQVAQFPYGYDFSGGGDDDTGDDSAEHRPGWGKGDENHMHDGPPGHEISDSTSEDSVGSADEEDGEDERSGNGWGDDKHEHVGPPGRDK